MSLSLLTNVASLDAQRNVNKTQGMLATSVERLSSGMRINHASDDAAGLAISSKMTAQLAGLKQASRNASDGVSLLQTAEGGLSQINDLLSRMRELAVQSASGGTMTNSDRTSVSSEFVALNQEIDRIVATTTYNGQALLSGGVSSTTFQVGASNSKNDRIGLTISAVSASALSLGSSNVSTLTAAQSAIGSLDLAISSLAQRRAGLGASQNRLASSIDALSSQYNNLAAANSRILDVDVAEESAAMTRNNILLQAGISVLSQANGAQAVALQLLRF